jgi:hypothetical protein
MLLVFEDTENRLSKLLRIVNPNHLSRNSVNHHFGQAAHPRCDCGHGCEERFAHSTTVL